MVMLAYLAAGAVVNVAVVWGIAVWVPLPAPARYQSINALPASFHMVPREWPPVKAVAIGARLGLTERHASFDHANVDWVNARYFIRLHQHGLPLRSMESWTLIEMAGKRPGQTPWENGLTIPPWFPRFMPYNTPYGGSISLRPIASGFAANSAFYGACLWFMALAASRARAASRSRRGLCPACAYPAGSSDRCTECGRALPRWVVRVREDNTPAVAMRERSVDA